MLLHWAEIGFWTTGLRLQVLLMHEYWMVPTFVMMHTWPERQVWAEPLGSGSQVTAPQAAVWTVQMPPAQTACVRPPLGQLS
jgi:hypothetical protein